MSRKATWRKENEQTLSRTGLSSTAITLSSVKLIEESFAIIQLSNIVVFFVNAGFQSSILISGKTLKRLLD